MGAGPSVEASVEEYQGEVAICEAELNASARRIAKLKKSLATAADARIVAAKIVHEQRVVAAKTAVLARRRAILARLEQHRDNLRETGLLAQFVGALRSEPLPDDLAELLQEFDASSVEVRAATTAIGERVAAPADDDAAIAALLSEKVPVPASGGGDELWDEFKSL